MQISLCPKCGSGKIEGKTLTIDGSDPPARCRSCGWEGTRGQLFGVSIAPRLTGGSAANAVVEALAVELARAVFVFATKAIGKAILAVKLFPAKELAEDERCQYLAKRLINAGAQAGASAACIAVIEEMGLIDKEFEEAALGGKDGS